MENYTYIRKTVTFSGRRYEVRGRTEEEACEKFLELLAQGNELDFAVWCVEQEKRERGELVLLLERSLALLRDALALQRGGDALSAAPQELSAVQKAAGLAPGRLLHTAELLEKLRKDAAFNVNAGQLCGALAAGVNGGSL